MSQINFEDETLDASDGVTKLLLAAEYWKAKASALRARIKAMEQQEPVGKFVQHPSNGLWEQDGYGDNPDANPLYALPGAQPAPQDWIERGLAELDAIRNRHDDDELLDDRTLIARIGNAILPGAQPAPSEEARLVSYHPDGETCTLNINGVEMYYDRVDRDTQPAPSVPDGWELVPIEVIYLYSFMCAAFVPVTPQQEEIALQLDLAKRAMLAVAPEFKP